MRVFSPMAIAPSATVYRPRVALTLAVGAVSIARAFEVAEFLVVLVLATGLALAAVVCAQYSKAERCSRLVVWKAVGAARHAVRCEALCRLVLGARAADCAIRLQEAVPLLAGEAAEVAEALSGIRMPARSSARVGKPA